MRIFVTHLPIAESRPSRFLNLIGLGLLLTITCSRNVPATELPSSPTGLSAPIKLEGKMAQWFFIEKKSGAVLPVQPGNSLIPQLPSPEHCCTGIYRTELNLKSLGLVSRTGQNILSYSILVPITGGLRRASLDEFVVEFPRRDYTSIETLVPVAPELLGRDHVTLSIEIESPPSFYAGMWNNAPLLGETEQLLSARDKNYTFQVIVPDFLAIFLLVFAAIFTWCWRQVQSRDPLYGEFAAALACWGIYYLFLSGQVRAWFPYFGGMFHMPMRLIAITALTRVIAIFAGIPRIQLRRATYIGAGFGLAQIATNLAYLEKLQPFLFVPFILFIAYANIRMVRAIHRKLDLLFFCASTVASFGFLSDTIRIASTLFEFHYPLFYLNRYTTPPLLFTSVFYLAYKLSREAEVSAKQHAYEQVSSQVAHDIRSPLAALAVAEGDLGNLPEDTRVIIRSAVGRIQDIANQLLERTPAASGLSGGKISSDDAHAMAPQLLPDVIAGIISEKRLQFRSKFRIEIDARLREESYGLFANIQLTEFKRVLSNLINNAVEALSDEKGSVLVTLKLVGMHGELIELRIQDNGRGIPETILEQLRYESMTYGKEGGKGLGLSHARRCLTEWNGSLRIESALEQGTSVIMTLPKSQPPAWFVDGLTLAHGTTVAILDDDDSIHQIWKTRFESREHRDHGIRLRHFSTPDAIIQWHRERERMTTADSGPVLYLVDFELLNFSETGLDVIEKLRIAQYSILITSRYEEPAIRRRCAVQNIRLIPKAMAGFVPIRLTQPNPAARTSSVDAILIDDDLVIRMAWSQAAKMNQKKLAVFANAQSFFLAAANLDRTTPIYLDSDLGDGAASGEEVGREIRSLGFTEIYLATGYAPELFEVNEMPWISGVTGKDVPWAKAPSNPPVVIQ